MAYINKTTYQNQEGYVALITVLVVLAVSVIIGTSLLLLGTDALRTSGASEDGARARSAADSCVETALSLINANNNFTSSLTSVGLSPPAGVSCSYTVTGTAPNKTIIVTGTSNSATKKLTTTTSQLSPSIVISGWQVVP